MQVKLAIAFCCLLVAVQARPKSEGPKCSQTCVASTMWKGYEPDSKYQYKFEHEVEVKSDLSDSQSSRMQLSGVATVEVHGECDLLLKVDVKQTKAASGESEEPLNPRESPELMREALRQPLRFSYENGKVTQLCPSASETRTSLNIKRGILSQLQISVERRGLSKTVKERDILGECWTRYTPSGPHAFIKTKDLARCKLNYKIFPPTSIKSLDEDRAQTNKIAQGNMKCRIELDAEKDFIKETACEEEHIHDVEDGQTKLKERVLVKTKLELQTKSFGLEESLYDVQERTGLEHVHASSKDCRSSKFRNGQVEIGAECGERQTPESGEHKEAAKKVLQTMCQSIKDDKFERGTARNFSLLVQYLRGITKLEDLEEVYQWAKDESECKAKSFFELILKSAIRSAGTQEAMNFAVKQLSGSYGSASSTWLHDLLWNTRNPSSDLLQPITAVLRSRSSETTDSALWYGYADLTYRVCLENDECESDPNVKAAIDLLSEKFEQACGSPVADREDEGVSMQRAIFASIANLGRVRGGIDAVIRCALNDKVAFMNRLTALSGLQRFTGWSFENVKQLVEVLGNRRLQPELRIAAYQVLVKFDLTPESQLLNKINEIMQNPEEDEQVQHYIFSHLKNLKKSQKYLVKHLIGNPRLIAKMAQMSRVRYSSNYANTFSVKPLGRDVSLDTSIIFSNKSSIPRSLNFNLSVSNPMMGRSLNLLDFSLHLSGMEQTLYDLYKAVADIKQQSRRARRSVEWSATDEQKSQHRPDEKSRFEIWRRENGAITSMWGVSADQLQLASTLSNALGGALRSTSMRQLTSMLNLVPESWMVLPSLDKVDTVTDEMLSIPTITGLPVMLRKEANFVVNTKIQPELSKMTEGKVELTVSPKAAVEMKRTIVVDAVFQRAGIETRSSLLSNTGVKLSLRGNFADKNNLGLSFKIDSLGKQKVADVKTEVNFYQQSSQGTQKKPLKVDNTRLQEKTISYSPSQAYLGHRLQIGGQYVESMGIGRSIMVAPSNYFVTVEKVPGFGSYEMAFSFVNKKKEKLFEVLLGDRNATIGSGTAEHLWKLKMQYKNENDKILNFAFINRVLPVQLHWNMTSVTDTDCKIGLNYRLLKTIGDGQGVAKFEAGKPLTLNFTLGVQADAETPESEKSIYKLGLVHDYTKTSYLLPQCDTTVELKYPDNSKLRMQYKFNIGDSNIAWFVGATLQHASGLKNVLLNRLNIDMKQEGTKNMAILAYDFEFGNKGASNHFVHSLQSKYIFDPKSETENTLRLTLIHTLSVNNKIRLGSCQATLRLNNKKEMNTGLTSDGELKMQLINVESQQWKSYDFKNIKFQLGRLPQQESELAPKSLVGLTLTFKCPQQNQYRLAIMTLPISQLTTMRQYFQFDCVREAPKNPEKKCEVKMVHKLEDGNAMQILKVQLNGKRVIEAKQELKKQERSIAHLLKFESIFTDKLQMTCKVLRPTETDIQVSSRIEKNAEKIFQLTQQFSIKRQEEDAAAAPKRPTIVKLLANSSIEVIGQTYAVALDAAIAEKMPQALLGFIGYQMNMINGRYQLHKSLQLLESLSRTLWLKKSLVLSGPTATNQLKVITKMSAIQADDRKFVFTIQNGEESKRTIDFALKLKAATKQQGEGSQTEVQIDAKNMEKTVETSLVIELPADQTNDTKITLQSKDSKSWHEVKVEWQSKKWTFEGTAKGKIGQATLDHSVTLKNSEEQKYELTLKAPESKFEIEYEPKNIKGGQQPDVRVVYEGIPMWSEAKYKVKFELVPSDSAWDVEAELKKNKQDVVGLKLKLSEAACELKLKTKYEVMEKLELEGGVEKKEEGATRINTKVAMKGLGEDFSISDDFVVKVLPASDEFLIRLELESTIEHSGLEEYMPNKKMQTAGQVQIKKNYEYSLDYQVTTDDRKVQLAQLISKLAYWPFEMETKLKAKIQGQENRLGVRVAVSETEGAANVELFNKKAEAKFTIQKEDKMRKLICEIGTNVFRSDEIMTTVKATSTVSWPLRLTNCQANVELQLPLQTVSMVKLDLTQKDLNELDFALGVVANGKDTKLIGAKYALKNPMPSIEGSIHVDMNPVYPGFPDFVASMEFLLKEDEQSLSVKITSADESIPYFIGKNFLLANARNVKEFSFEKLEKGIYLWVMNASFFYLVEPQTDVKAKHHTEMRFDNENIVKCTIVMNGPEFESGNAEVFGQKVRVENPEAGKINVYLNGQAEKPDYSLVYRNRFDSWKSMDLMLNIRKEGGFDQAVGLKVDENTVKVIYGQTATPSILTLKREYLPSLKLTFEHIPAKENGMSQEVMIPYIDETVTVVYGIPFKFTCEYASPLDLTVSGNVADVLENLLYRHKIESFKKFQVESKLKLPNEQERFGLNIDVSYPEGKISINSQLLDLYKVEIDAPKFTIELTGVAKLQLDAPTLELLLSNTESKKLEATLELPILSIEKPFTLIVNDDIEAEKRSIDIQYKRGPTSEAELRLQLNVNELKLRPDFAANIDIALNLEPKFAENLRSIGLQLEASRTKSGSQYTVKGKTVVKVNQDEWSSTEVELNGQEGTLPADCRITLKGAVDSQLEFNLQKPDGSKTISWKMEKWGSIARKYDFLVEIGAKKEGSLMRDFHLGLETPKRHYLLSKKIEQTGTSSSVVCQFYLNKRAKHGVSTTLTEEGESADWKQKLELDLSTRMIVFSRTLKDEGETYARTLKLALNGDSDPSQTATVTIRNTKNMNYGKDIKIECECEAPWLKNKEKLEYSLQRKTNGLDIQLKRTVNGNTYGIGAMYKYEDANERNLTVTTYGPNDQQSSRVELVLKSEQRGEQQLYKCQLNLKTQSVERQFLVQLKPMEELTISCDKGYFVSLRHSNNMMMRKLTLTGAGAEEKAGSVSITLLKEKRQVRLDVTSGSGSFDRSAEYQNYRPQKSLAVGRAGLAENAKRLFFAIYSGEMTIGQKLDFYNGEKAAESGLAFCAGGLKLEKASQLNYYLQMNSNSEEGETLKVKDFFRVVYETLANQIPETVPTMQGMQQSVADTLGNVIDSDKIAGLIASFLHHVDELSKFCNNMKRNNDFFVNDIAPLVEDLVEFTGSVLAKSWYGVKNFARFCVKEVMPAVADRLSEVYDIVEDAVEDFLSWVQDCVEDVVEFVELISEKFWQLIDRLSENETLRFIYEQIFQLKYVREALQAYMDKVKQFVTGMVMESVEKGSTTPFFDFISFVVDLIASVRENLKQASDSDKQLQEVLFGQNLLETVASEDSIQYWDAVKKSSQLLANGQISESISQLLQKTVYTQYTWRPVCDAACAAEGSFAVINGSVNMPIQMDSLDPLSWHSRYQAVQQLCNKLANAWSKFFATSSDGYVVMSVLNDWRLRGSSMTNPVDSLISLAHRTAIIQGGRHIVTFDGMTIQHNRPCNYLIARHQSEHSVFSVIQTYKRDGEETVRDQLWVRIGSLRASISRDGIFRVQDKIEMLPVQKAVGAYSVEAKLKGSSIVARFHSSVPNTLIVRCSKITDSCVVKVHPLFVGQVAGAAGSMDSRRTNDITGDAKQHMKTWTAGECLEEGDVTHDTNDEKTQRETPVDEQCRRWFVEGESSFDKCFEKVQPQPFLSMCQNFKTASKDICKVAMMYTEMCRNEHVNINTPQICVKCQLENGREIKSNDLIQDPSILKKKLQVLFLVENSECAKNAVTETLEGSSVMRAEHHAKIIDGFSRKQGVQTIEFGLGQYGGDEELRAYSVKDDSDTFGSTVDLLTAMKKMDKTPKEIGSFDVLKALAQVDEKFSWDPLAIKRIILFTCNKCQSNSWEYLKLFGEAANTIGSKIGMDVVTLNGIPAASGRSDLWHSQISGLNSTTEFQKNGVLQRTVPNLVAQLAKNDCPVELTLGSERQVPGSVWRMSEYGSKDQCEATIKKMLDASLAPILNGDQLKCLRCSCTMSQTLIGRPQCSLVDCPGRD